MTKLKCDLHLHSNSDPKERHLGHSSRQLIDHMSKNGFDVVAITYHDGFAYTKELADYAKRKGILLIPGTEKRIENKEVLLYNIHPDELKKIKRLSDLKEYRRDDTLIIAPHPYYILPQCLNSRLEENIDGFDAIEHCMLYYSIIGRNGKAKKIAKKFKKPMIANSDGHQLRLIGTNYSIIDADKEMISIFNAIKKGKIKIKSRPLSISEIFHLVFSIIKSRFDPNYFLKSPSK